MPDNACESEGKYSLRHIIHSVGIISLFDKKVSSKFMEFCFENRENSDQTSRKFKLI